ncbi:MAG: transporter [Thermoanaerobaculaceae bacterium]|jgi:hypothetical protein|nr:transporter [Thermoanaerobaculaceae bacterium]
MRCWIPIAVLLLCVPLAARAQGADLPPISPDRPDFCNGADIVPPGMLQVESGVSYTAGSGDHGVGVGELNLRVPLSRNVEVAVQLGTYMWDVADSKAESGFSDGALGCKIRLFDGFPSASGRSPRLALVMLTSLPTGSHAFRSPRMQPQVTLAADMDLSPDASLSANVGVMKASEAGERYLAAYGGASLGVALGGAWSGFFELFAWQPGSAGGTTRSVVDAGLQLLLGNDISLDARVGRTTGDGATSTSGGLGISFRW